MIDLEFGGRRGLLGLTYHDWIVDNPLTASIPTDYRQFHEMLCRS